MRLIILRRIARVRLFPLVLVTALAGCSGSLIPPGDSNPPPRTSSETRPISAGAEIAARPVPATPRPTLPPVPPGTTAVIGGAAVKLGLAPGPSVASLSPDRERSVLALRAFRISCPSLLRRADQSGLTKGSDWNASCAAAASWPEASAGEFFDRFFETAQLGDGATFVTGYYEPEIAGVRQRQPGFDVPVYGRPSDLVEVDLGLFSDAYKGKKIRGKVQANAFVPYDERTDIVAGSLTGRAPVVAWAADDIEFFFLQVQGSGRLIQPDGSVVRIGYDSQNGRDYTGIGKLMKDRGLIRVGSMQDIIGWLRANPGQAQAIMNENKSFVFFRELTGAGPLGAMGLPLTPRGSVAADPAYIPLGIPVLLSLDRAEPNGIWVAQDTGGAIKGANRFDSFWGAGSDARAIAGGMSARGSAFILLPRGTYARLASENGWATPAP